MNDVQIKILHAAFPQKDLVVVQMWQMSKKELEDHILILELFLLRTDFDDLQREMIRSRLVTANEELASR
jgi:hypothetical protein